MTNKVSFSKDKIRSFAEEGKSVPDMASALNADLEELTQFYAECYEEDHDAFPLRLLVTKTWLDEKLKSEPVSHIARSVRATPRTIKNLMKVYGLKKEKLSDILTPEVLYTLFVVNGLTDKEIAKQYGCSIESIKKIRAKSNIVHSGRLEVGGGLSIEMFHKLYVEYGFTKTEIAKLMRYPYFRVNKIHSEFANSDHPLAASLKDAPRNYAFTDLINLLLDTVEPAVLFELLKDHTLAQVAEMYELIPPSEPGNEPFTPEWLDAQLKKMDIKEIISTYHIGSTFVHEMMKQGDMQRVPVQDRLDEETVRTLFVDKRWSEAKIAKALGTSVYAVARFRAAKGITADQRKKMNERLDRETFENLYLSEGLSLEQIASIYDVCPHQIKVLKDEYAKVNPDLSSYRARGVTPERLAYIKKKLKYDGMARQ